MTITGETKLVIAEAVATAVEKTQASTMEAVTTALERLQGREIKPPLLTVRQTIEYLNSSRAALYRLEQAGVLVPTRFGRKVLYQISDLDGYIARAGGGQLTGNP